MTRPMTRPALVLLAGLLAILPAAPASAAARDKIIQDCADDGRLQGSYSRSELRDARQNLPSDIAEYTDCADVLRRAELPDRNTGGGTGPGGGGGTPGAPGAGGAPLTPASPEEQKALDDIRTGKSDAVEVDGETIVPGAAGLAPDAVRNGIPGTLLAVLVLLAAAGIAAAVPAARRAAPRLSLPWRR